MASFDFALADYENVDTSGGAPVYEDGDYPMLIAEAPLKDTKQMGGKRVALKLMFVDGQYAGKIIYHSLNIVNAHELAEKIARAQLSQIARAIGKPQLSDTDELIDQVVIVRLKKVKQQDGSMRSEPKEFKPLAVTSTPQAAASNNNTATTTPSW